MLSNCKLLYSPWMNSVANKMAYQIFHDLSDLIEEDRDPGPATVFAVLHNVFSIRNWSRMLSCVLR